MSEPEQLPPELSAQQQPESLALPSEFLSAAVVAPERRFPAWSGWDIGLVLGFTLLAIVVGSTLALGVAHVMTSHQHVPVSQLASDPFVIIGSQIVAYPVVVLFMIALVRGKSGEDFASAIHWNWRGGQALFFVAGGVVLAIAIDWLSRYLPIPKSLPVDKYFSDATSAYLMAVFGITLAPLLEELFFRGMLYPLVRRTVGVTTAVLFTATTFTFIHGAQLGYAWAPLVSIFVVGVVFTVIREKTESVASSFLAHFGYNLTLFGMLWVGSNHFRHLEKVTN